MNKVIVKNTSIVVNDYTLGDCPKIESYFTIFDRITFTKHLKGMSYDEDTKTLYLPRGLDLYFIERYLEASPVRDFSYDEYIQSPEILLRYLPRDDVQKEALSFILAKGEYYQNAKATQLSINLPTGKGKTYVTIASMAFWRARSVVIASTVGWLEQWRNCIGEYTNLDMNKEVLIINSSVTIHKILNDIIDVSKYSIFLITHSTLNNFGTNNGWKSIGELFRKLKVFLKVYDEAHLNFDNICMVDFYTNTRKTMYLTATPGRSDNIENFIYKLYFKNVPDINLFNPEDDPHTRYTALRYNSRPEPIEMKSCTNNVYGLDRNAYTNYIVQKETFYEMMYIVMDKVMSLKGKVLFYIGTNEAILVVKEWLEENYPEYRNDIGIYTSIIPKEQKPDELSKTIILTTTKSAGAALDIKGLKATFILAEPFKSEIIAKQVLGRTRDPNTECIELVDDGFRSISRFYNAKKPIMNKFAIECREIKIDYSTLSAKATELFKIRENVKWQYNKNYAVIFYNANLDKSKF